MLEPRPLTELLHAWNQGDANAFEDLIERVYGELRTLSRNILRNERNPSQLESRELVNMLYQSLMDKSELQWENRRHFFKVAARSMRRILVAEARRISTEKRGGIYQNTTLEDEHALAEAYNPEDWILVNDLVSQLEKKDQQSAQIVELRYFAGFTVTEAAEILETSTASTVRKWRFAKAWLVSRLEENHELQ